MSHFKTYIFLCRLIAHTITQSNGSCKAYYLWHIAIEIYIVGCEAHGFSGSGSFQIPCVIACRSFVSVCIFAVPCPHYIGI